MPYRIHIKTCVCLIAICCSLKTANGQGLDQLKEVILGPAQDLDRVPESLTALEYMIDGSEVNLKSGAFLTLLRQTKFGVRRLSEMIESKTIVDELFIQRQQIAINRIIAQLTDRREALKQVMMDRIKNDNRLVVSESALQHMVEKVGEAQIQHRLRELESQALIEALKETASKHQNTPLYHAQVERCERLLEISRKRVAASQKLSDTNKDSHNGLEKAKLAELDAEAILINVRSGLEFKDSINKKITDAAIAQTVSARMQKLLAEESLRINGLFHQSLELAEIRSEIDLLNEQIHRRQNDLFELETQSNIENREVVEGRITLKRAKEVFARVDSLLEDESKPE